ncbi:hypothetical protein EYF80_001312 [Liparis tanakae]|uniref:Uncharacterized protein n=1 Tax=Liparis tanakae TaxID=230148 RepID=A0A4Z2JE70_9TELE|nr:hypothetical protein EYF80_001312 [Liparis tanakae]
MHRAACGSCGESLELEAPVALSSVGWKVVRVQVVVAGALRHTVVPVQKGVLLVHWFQVVVRLPTCRISALSSWSSWSVCFFSRFSSKSSLYSGKFLNSIGMASSS